MAGGGGRSLQETPTWAVAVVCFVLVVISIFIEYIIHLIGKWLTRRHKRALYEALEKIKQELMLLGFISLLLTVGQGLISKICVPTKVGNSWHPCDKKQEAKIDTSTHTETSSYDSSDPDESIGRKLLWSSGSESTFRRILAGASYDNCEKKARPLFNHYLPLQIYFFFFHIFLEEVAASNINFVEGKVPLISSDGIHQLHIFIFVLALSHVLYCITTMALGRAKMRSWKSWEKETKTAEYEFSHDPERFRFARETSFGRRHLNFWTKSPILIWIVCFFRQFVRSVPKVDYLTLRHGFIMAHLAPQSSIKFDFRNYIKRSLEEDFKVVVGISPTIWFFAVIFLLFNTHGWYSYLWMPFIPLIVILLVGTKLQVIITQMGLKIQERGDVVKGIPVVEPHDNLFWFNQPRLLLYLIHFVLFQNAFQLAFFAWTWYEFGLRSCFHERLEDVIIRISMGVLIQFLCSYVTLPLYALVTQMGSNMKSTIFNERVATALKKWHHTARKHVKESRRSGSITPLSTSRPGTPMHGLSPVHLLRHYRSDADSLQNSPRFYNSDNDKLDPEDGSSSRHQFRRSLAEQEKEMEEMSAPPMPQMQPDNAQHDININPSAFSFAKR
ncbi:MLO-like protein 6 [Cinnamomum micranthum f. kanehirae]|uniref:MLO-like protein n=1 Tax=Cinnamomum micranthum f. kanehirae TaxID=337451 RepID=A0A443PXU6_9MAGN|nr:MLO-like protein 6 [Cinnamomum micranthum f. kanehirae]